MEDEIKEDPMKIMRLLKLIDGYHQLFNKVLQLDARIKALEEEKDTALEVRRD